ncbi:FAD-dependent monooxygenase [Aureimonas glaciei]|uniref:Monooxygenase n=1 Tax=Aureimonas glaciei TaxID=1776957 RepID=A0A917DCD4_9HYPH|nr:NAD(P)/FAD-dependent oxidoreductase [Aureimonas glaciei]GGD26293.1 monooxygenase [Aureimonas glaciei]
MDDTLDVFVAGAGIAGLALMRELHRRNIRALAVDQRAGPADAGLAVNLPGNAIAALRRLGLGDAMAGHGRSVERREYRSAAGGLLFAVDERKFWGSDLTPRCMRRGDLASLLAGGLPEQAVRWGTQVTSVSESSGRVVIGTLADRRYASKFLVGADGIHSTVRRLRFESTGTLSARLASASWRFMAPDPGVDCWTIWASADALVLLIPVDHGEVYGWAAATKDRGKLDDPAILRNLLRSFPVLVRETVEAALSSTGRMHYSPLEEVRASKWSSGRTLLIGDAAHATGPVWAQGAALGLEDALVLAELVGSRSDWTLIGEDFERLRRHRVDHVQAMTDRMSRVAQMPVQLRNTLMRFIGSRSYKMTYEPLKAPL